MPSKVATLISQWLQGPPSVLARPTAPEIRSNFDLFCLLAGLLASGPLSPTYADALTALTALTALLERDSGQGMTGSRGMLRSCHQLSKPNTRFQHEVGGHQVSNGSNLQCRKNMEKKTVQFSNNLTVSNALCMYHALGDSIVKLIPNLCMLPPVLRTTFSMRPPKEIICKGTNPFPSSWLWHAQARKYEHV